MWHLQTQNGVAKTHRLGDWFDIWLCARNRRCHFDFCQCQVTSGKIVLDGKSKENLEKNCGIQFFFLVFSSFWTVCDYPKLKQQQRLRFRERLALFEEKTLAPVLVKNRFGFCKTGSVAWKSATDFGKISHRLWENEPPTLGKWATKFGKISDPLWENQPPSLGKWTTDFGKKWATDFGEMNSGDARKFETDYFKKYH